MSSVADELRRERRRDLLARSPEERVTIAFELGARDLALFRRASGLDERGARAELRRRRQIGRVRSGCMEALLA